MATVYKRGKSKTWWVRFVWGGQSTRRSAHTTSKAVAERYLAQLLDKNDRLARGGRPRHTYKEALHRYSAEYLPNLKEDGGALSDKLHQAASGWRGGWCRPDP